MELTLKERLVILNTLPKQGDFVTLTAKSDLVDKIKVTQDEIAELQVESNESGLKWNGEKDVEKEFDITPLETKLVKDALTKLDGEKNLTDDMVSICKKFL